MHAGQDDDLGVDRHRLPCQRQTVADDVSNAVEDLWRHVVMREDDSVPFALQPENSIDILSEDRPFHRRDQRFDAVVEGGCTFQQRSGGHKKPPE